MPGARTSTIPLGRSSALQPSNTDGQTVVFASTGIGISLTIPERIGGFNPTGSTVVFETSIDDYAEIWVDGELTRPLGQIRPGQKIQLAVFGINGPISNHRPTTSLC